MKKKLLLFLVFVILGVLQAAIFMMIYSGFYGPYSFGECLLSLVYSLPQAVMVAAWAIVPAFLVGIFYVFIKGEWHRRFMIRYVTLVALVTIAITVTDWNLFAFWGIRLDTTSSVYIMDNPLEALKEVPWSGWIGIAVALFIVGWICSLIMRLVYPKRRHGCYERLSCGFEQMREWLGNLIMAIVMVIVGCGCFGWMGMSSAYHSSHEPLNNASINPIYSLAHSIRMQQIPLGEQYRFMSEAERARSMEELESMNAGAVAVSGMDSLQVSDTVSADSVNAPIYSESLLKPGISPNILVIFFESFSGSACHYLYPEADERIMPCVGKAMAEGVAFTQCYANSFRTERGMAAALASFPGQPTYTIMNDQERCRHLDYLSLPLASAGYSLEFVHGGDGTFLGLPNFLSCGGIVPERQTDRRRFPKDQYDCEWGMGDGYMFTHLAGLLKEEAKSQIDTLAEYPAQPYFKFFPTISSHEPFVVPFHRFENAYLNSVAYADSCFGAFIDEIRQDSTIWDNLLIIGMADHCYAAYPENIQQHDPMRYHIPVFWTGGAVAGHRDITTYCQQTDLAATLFAQLGIQASGFKFSHDILSANAPHFAFYAWPDGFGFLTESCRYIQANDYDGHPLDGSNDPEGKAQKWGKAYLQTIYNEMDALKK